MTAALTMTKEEWSWLSSRCDSSAPLDSWTWQKLLRQARFEIEALRAVVAAADKMRALASCEGDSRAYPGCCEQCTAACHYDAVRGPR